MAFRDVQNPGIGGLDELTSTEEILLQEIDAITHADGTIIVSNGTSWVGLASSGSDGDVLTVQADGSIAWEASPAGSGTVTSVSATTANGLQVSITNATTAVEMDFTLPNLTDFGDITFQTGATGGTVRTGTSNADKFVLQAYDVNDGVYRTMLELDAGNTPLMSLLHVSEIDMDTGSAIKASTASGNTFTIQAYDVDGTAFVDVATITSQNDPTFSLDTTYLRLGSLTGVLRADSGVVSTDSDVTDLVTAATSAQAGKIEIATTAEVQTGTDDTRAVSPAGLATVTALGSLGTVNTTLTGVLRADSGVLSVDTDVTDLVGSATSATAGKIEIATTAEVQAGTDDTRAVSPYTLSYLSKSIGIELKDPSTSPSTSTAVGFLTIPEEYNGYNLIGVHGEVYSSATADIIIDVNKNGTSMLSTKLTIDANELGSDTATTAAVIDTAQDDVSTNDRIDFNIDTGSTTAKGLFIRLRFRKP